MAAADYRSCDICGSKTFYDSNLGYDFNVRRPDGDLGLPGLGDWAVICVKCAETHKCIVVHVGFGQPVIRHTKEHMSEPLRRGVHSYKFDEDTHS